MSCGHSHEIPCNEVAQVIYFFIDDEIDALHEQIHAEAVADTQVLVLELASQGITHIPTRSAIEIHFEECPPCHEVLERETQAMAQMKSMLGRSCNEEAPADLQALIAAQTRALAAQMAATTTSVQYSRTEITTTIIDENGAQTTIEIQSSTEFRGEFPSF